jgi:hypothetical protein
VACGTLPPGRMRPGRRLEGAPHLLGKRPSSVLRDFQGGVKVWRQRASWEEASLCSVHFPTEAIRCPSRPLASIAYPPSHEGCTAGWCW